MAQADGVVANGTGSAVRADINGQLAALFTNHSGSTEPATTFAFQTWADTNTSTLKLRNSSNDGWIQLARLDGQFDAKTFNGNITLNAQSDLRLADSDSSNWVAFQAPATVASNLTWTLPATDGTSGQALTTNGSGTLSWTSPAASTDIISEGNTSAEVVDTGSDGHFKVVTEGTEALRVTSAQRLGIGVTAPATTLHLGNSSTLRINNPDGTRNLDLFNDGSNAEIKASVDPLRLNAEHSTGYIRFDTNNTERARIDSSGRMGLGTTAPGNYDSAGDNLVAYSTGETGITIASGTSNGGNIYFADGTTGNEQYRGWITYSHSVDAMRFGTSGTERARITSSGDFQFNSGYGSFATAYGVRAWVNFNGTGTVSIRASGNCSGITDRGIGQYTMGYTNAMPDANYAVTATANDNATTSNVYTYGAVYWDFGTTGVKIDTHNNSTIDDYQQVCVAIIR